MSHYERRLAADKQAIRGRLVKLGEQVEQAVGASVEALLAGDHRAAGEIILADLPINRETRAIDKACHAFVARHLPSAGHLRFVSTALRLTVELERVGDYAVTIAREVVQLSAPAPDRIAQDIRRIGKEVREMLAQAVRAFADQDPELARETKPLAKAVSRTYDEVFEDLLARPDERPLRDLFALLTVFNRLHRVASQAKNLCEETLFETLGESKPPKVYRVLFVDARDTLVGPLAVGLAKKAFPKSGRYESAGWQAGETLAPELTTLGEELGLELTGPRRLVATRDALAPYHVIVCLHEAARAQLREIPFSTAVIDWDLPRLADARDPREGLRDLTRSLGHQITELVTTLRGEGAD